LLRISATEHQAGRR